MNVLVQYFRANGERLSTGFDLHAHGGIAITASHNPPQWNALKFVSGEGIFLNQQQGRKVISIYENRQQKYTGFDGLGFSFSKPTTARIMPGEQ